MRSSGYRFAQFRVQICAVPGTEVRSSGNTYIRKQEYRNTKTAEVGAVETVELWKKPEDGWKDPNRGEEGVNRSSDYFGCSLLSLEFNHNRLSEC